MNKKGLILPYVMLFMFVSHLMYLGILQINQLQLQHFHQLQGHYIAQLQSAYVEQQLRPTSNKIQQEIRTQLDSLLQAQLKDYVVTSQQPFQEVGSWIEATDSTAQSFVFICYPCIYLTDAYLQTVDAPDYLPFSDYASGKGLTLSQFSATIQTQLDGRMQLINQAEQEIVGDIHQTAPFPSEWSFTTGSVSYQSAQTDSLTILNQVPNYRIARKQTLSLPTAHYVIKWFCLHYQLATSDNSN